MAASLCRIKFNQLSPLSRCSRKFLVFTPTAVKPVVVVTGWSTLISQLTLTWVEESSGCPEENRWAATIRKGDGWGASRITDVGGGEKNICVMKWLCGDFMTTYLTSFLDSK